jgi:hypothetical protein
MCGRRTLYHLLIHGLVLRHVANWSIYRRLLPKICHEINTEFFKIWQRIYHREQTVAHTSHVNQRTDLRKVNISNIIDIDIFVNCNWVTTRWQLYSTYLHTNNT